MADSRKESTLWVCADGRVRWLYINAKAKSRIVLSHVDWRVRALFGSNYNTPSVISNCRCLGELTWRT